MVTISFFFSFTGSSLFLQGTAVSSSVVAAVSVFFFFAAFFTTQFLLYLVLFDWIVGMQIVRHDSS